MENQINELQDQEISLKEIIEIILKRKYIVLASVLICFAISFIVSFFILQPVYESKSSYLISPISIASGITPNTAVILTTTTNPLGEINKIENKMLGSILSHLSYPNFDIPTMINYMKSDEYLINILASNNIDTKTYDFKKQITITLNSISGTIDISVKSKDPEVATKINSSIIASLPDFMITKAEEKINTIDKTIVDNVKSESERFKTLSSSVSPTLVDDLTLSQQTLYAYKLISKELTIIKKIDIKSMINVQQISADQLPLTPISPNKTMNIAISLMLGLMIGLFLTFFLDYLNKNFGLKV